MMPKTVEVFNADYRAFGVVSWMDAVRMLLREVVYVVERYSPAVHIHSPSITLELPVSVALWEYAHVPYRPPLPTREAILRRDGHTCCYCGGRANTIDHVLPRSRGGGDTWINLVSSCENCNGCKGNRLPQEAKMSLIREPFEPRDRDKFKVFGIP
jgi:5-methylcytosine-specific restriction endonuclease McrA